MRLNPHYLALILGLTWNTLLVWYRVDVTDRRIFIFFLWNLLLSVIPYLSSEAAVYSGARKWVAIPLVLLTVLFLPNAPYIITDFFHLRTRADMPLWYDTLLIFSMAATSWLLFYLALFNIRALLRRWWNGWMTEIVIALICLLCGFGIYLGRYLRFNSWDILSNPNDLIDEIAERLINPSVHTRMVGVTLLYGAFLLTGYWVVRLYNNKK
jgi:uncharacterized membrane protein